MDQFNLNRFIEAQDGVYHLLALKEVKEGRKRSHWIWYIFPQLRQLGYSCNARFYRLSGIDEASAYLEHPVLGHRLREIADAALQLPDNDPVKIFGYIDSIKLRSSMTLFDAASPDDIFARVIDKFFNGQRDPKTLTLIK